jgi:hypothetical protein
MTLKHIHVMIIYFTKRCTALHIFFYIFFERKYYFSKIKPLSHWAVRLTAFVR